MTSATTPMITRCPKCGTAFRITATQLQSAKGAVRCGSCLHVFKAQEYVVATTAATKPTPIIKTTSAAPLNQSADEASAAVLSTTQSPKIDAPAPITAATKISPTISKDASSSSKSVIHDVNTSLPTEADDILISDDMDSHELDSKSYELDSFMDIDSSPKTTVSLFERKAREKETEPAPLTTDESWAEMLIEDEEEVTTKLSTLKPYSTKTDEQLADDELNESQAKDTSQSPYNTPAELTPKPAPGLMFSLVGEANEPSTEDIILSDELAQIPSHKGFNAPATEAMPDASLFEEPDQQNDNNTKRQLKTQPKIRAYDGSRTALLMNIIPAPIEFSAKRMRHWYQHKLWPSLSILALIALTAQVAWFKFDYFSRVEPYRTGYLFLCPYVGCQVPTLIDTRQIVASNLVVREHPEAPGALAVDVMLINGAPFDQPFPDLVLIFTDINEQQVAARRFIPKDYLGGELVGRELMPQNQKIHITLDLVDPGAEAVNYHISIPHN